MAKDQEVRRLLETVARNNQYDLGSLEHALRVAVLAAGAALLFCGGMARAGSRSTFKEAQQDLAVYAGIEVSALRCRAGL